MERRDGVSSRLHHKTLFANIIKLGSIYASLPSSSYNDYYDHHPFFLSLSLPLSFPPSAHNLIPLLILNNIRFYSYSLRFRIISSLLLQRWERKPKKTGLMWRSFKLTKSLKQKFHKCPYRLCYLSIINSTWNCFIPQKKFLSIKLYYKSSTSFLVAFIIFRFPTPRQIFKLSKLCMKNLKHSKLKALQFNLLWLEFFDAWNFQACKNCKSNNKT